MKYNREFELAWQGLKPGQHNYQYDLDDRFMVERGAGEEFSNWNVRVNLGFDKHENFFMLHFDIDGRVTVACDRCGDDFEMKLWDEFDLLIKLDGSDEDEMPEEESDVVFIPRSETVIDISTWLYEFVMLSIPLQHIHPDTEDGASGCNPEVLKYLGTLADAEEPHNEEQLWKGLAALKDLKIDEEGKNGKKTKK